MPCFEGFIEKSNKILIDVLVSESSKKEIKINSPDNLFKGLLDTGATHTCISNKIVGVFNLISEEQVEVNSVTDTRLANVYNINFYLPISKSIVRPSKKTPGKLEQAQQLSFFVKHNIQVCELLKDPIGYDVLIGMDILKEFSINIYSDKFILCF